MSKENPRSDSQEKLLALLRELILLHFNESELRDLCFLLGVDYDLLEGSGKGNKSRELLLFLNRRGGLAELIEVGRASRPDVSWPDILDAAPENITLLADLAVLSQEKPAGPPPTLQVEAQAGPLLLIMTGRSGKWKLQVENQDSASMFQATIIFKPPTTIAVAPKLVTVPRLEAGERLITDIHINIRPNQRVINTAFQLKFDVVLQTEGQSKRHKGILHIPVK